MKYIWLEGLISLGKGINGLIIDLANDGYSDISLKVDDGEVLSVKSLLCHQNAVLKDLIKDPKRKNPLPLNAACRKESIMMLMQYYGGGKVNLTEKNVGGLLLLCLYYNEKELLVRLKKYAIMHMNAEIVKELLNNSGSLKMELISDVCQNCDLYIKENGNLFSDSKILKDFNISGIKHILSIPNLLVNDENKILNGLVEYYKVNQKRIEGNTDMKNGYKELFEYINWKEIKIKTLPFDDLKPFNTLPEMMSKSMKHNINRLYCHIPELTNEKMLTMVKKFFLSSKPLLQLNDVEMNILNQMEIRRDITLLLNSENLKLVKISIIIIIDMKMNYEIEKKLQWILLLDLLKNYKEDNLSDEEKQVSHKCLSFFVDCYTLRTIYETCGYYILYMILNLPNVTMPKAELIIKFIREIKILKDAKMINEMKATIKNETIKTKILVQTLTYFRYPKSDYIFTRTEPISIKCETDGEECNYSIIPKDLPEGLRFNKKTGEFKGRITNVMDEIEYEVKCQQSVREFTARISLSIIDFAFTKKYKSSGMLISNGGKMVTNTDDNYNHCYINAKLETGIYHMKFRSIFTNHTLLCFGLSTMNNYTGSHYHQHQSAKSIRMSNTSELCGTNKVMNPDFANHNGDIYELVINMATRVFTIKQNDGIETVLFDKIEDVVYPFVEIDYKDESVELLSVVIE